MKQDRAGYGHNLEYEEGFKLEAYMLDNYSKLIADMVGVAYLEEATRGTLDKKAGIDALGVFRSNTVTGIALRYRNRDYNSFTLSRHISDEYSEVHKWTNRKQGAITPAHFVQIADKGDYVRIIHVDILAFSYFLQRHMKEGTLQQFWNSNLDAYEFKLRELDTPAVRDEVVRKDRVL